MRLLPRSLPRSTAWLALVAAFVACASEEATAPGASTRTCTAPAFPAAFRLVDVLPGIALERPVAVAMSGDAYFIAEQGGVVRRVFPADGGWRSETFVDLSSRLAPEGGSEGGLVGFTLSPDFESSGEAFAFYIGVSDRPLFESIIVRLTSRDRRTVTSSEPVFVLHREVPDELGHHYAGHHGGRLRFGPDRQLYVGIGDGAWRDPLARAANPHELFGKVLRIDVLGGKPYRIPDDNPFVRGGGRPEVWALGFRNPWSFWFDPSGRLWLGDVGHDRWEEIDLVVKGGNYGWPYREGRHCFGTTPCDVANVIDPVHEIPRPDGFSVVAGFVYRGDSLPALDGRFLFGDFITGRIWSLDGASDTPGDDRLVLDSGVNLTAIEEGREGEPLVLDYAGRLLRMERGFGGELVSAAEPSSASAPVSLGSLGCLDPSGSGQMDHALVSYEINSELWSDGLDKQRWLGLPRGTRVHVREDGELDFPVGTIFLKEFSSRGRRIETRMLTNDPEIGWRGYTFEWNEAQTDATLIEESKTVDVDGSPWTLPSQAQCFACHRSTARRTRPRSSTRVTTAPRSRTARDPGCTPTAPRVTVRSGLERRWTSERPSPLRR